VAVDQDQRMQFGDRRHANLGWLSLFQGADESSVIEAIGDSEVLLLPPNDVLLQPGDANNMVYLVLSGQLAAILGEGGALDRQIPIFPGECLGELSAIDGKPVSALVKVIVEARVLRLSQDVFWNRLMAVPGVARNLLAVLAQRMRRNTDAMLEGQRREIELRYIRQELDVARQLQLGMLPLHRPLFPDRHDIEIAGMMEAASLIGGDLFDAFFVDDQRLFFCVGDVSGHGIPAAMFMARTISLMRVAAFGTTCPASLLEQLNEQLCAGNDANMFVTLFCGFLDVASGRIVYSNAGHLAPLHWGDSTMGCLPMPKGPVVGVIPGTAYSSYEVVLHEGDFVLCFTDGVSEAQTPAGEEFSEARLAELVGDAPDLPLEMLLHRVRQEVTRFVGDSRLADDCTLLAIRRPPTLA
jgi:sigma-B regulation protein RsbU (phosphoserine phosphatase)